MVFQCIHVLTFNNSEVISYKENLVLFIRIDQRTGKNPTNRGLCRCQNCVVFNVMILFVTIIVCVCLRTCMCMCLSVHMDVKGQLSGDGFVLPPSVCAPNSGPQACEAGTFTSWAIYSPVILNPKVIERVDESRLHFKCSSVEAGKIAWFPLHWGPDRNFQTWTLAGGTTHFSVLAHVLWQSRCRRMCSGLRCGCWDWHHQRLWVSDISVHCVVCSLRIPGSGLEAGLETVLGWRQALCILKLFSIYREFKIPQASEFIIPLNFAPRCPIAAGPAPPGDWPGLPLKRFS